MQVMGSGEVRSTEYVVRSTENGVGGMGYERVEYRRMEYVMQSRDGVQGFGARTSGLQHGA